MEDEDVRENRRDVTAVGWRSDGKFLAVATVDYVASGTWANPRLTITDVAENVIIVDIELPDNDAASTIHWLPDFTGFVVGLELGTIQVYDFPTFSLRKSFKSRIGLETTTMASLSPDGRNVAVAAEYYNPLRDNTLEVDDGTIRLRVFDIMTGTPVAMGRYARSIEEFPRWVSWNPDGTTVALLDTSGRLSIWDFADGSLNLNRQISTGARGPIVGGAYNASGDAVALYGYRTDFVDIINVETGQTIRTLDNSSGVRGLHWNWTTNQIAGVSGDGATRSGLVRVWNADTGALMQTFTFPETMTEQVAWSAGGALAIATSTTIPKANMSSQNVLVESPALSPTPTLTDNSELTDADGYSSLTFTKP